MRTSLPNFSQCRHQPAARPVLILLLFCFSCQKDDPGDLPPITPLSGEWEVTVNDAAPVRVPLPGNLYNHPAFQHERPRRFRIKREVILTGGLSGIGLRTGILSDGDRTFFNGRLIGQNQAESAGPVSYDRSRIYHVPDNLLRPGPNQIEIDIDAYFAHEAGLVAGDPAIGPLSRLHSKQMIEEMEVLFPAGILFAAGIYFLMLFVRRARDPSELWLGIFFALLAVYLSQRSTLKYTFQVELIVLKRLEYAVLFLIGPTLSGYLSNAFPRQVSARNAFLSASFSEKAGRLAVEAIRLTGGMAILLLCAATLWTCASSDLRSWDFFNVKIVQRLLWPILCFVGMLRPVSASLRGDRAGRVLLAGIVLSLAGAATDVLSHQGIWHVPTIAHLTFLSFPAALAAVQIDRMARMQSELENWNRSLEERVSLRTTELQMSLNEVKCLKEQQDGDYFLTSLLLRPLEGRADEIRSSCVEGALLCRQKKSFLFRERQVELGGDLNIVRSLTLRGRPHLAILNGDAMGKSIQGAGGALVLGTVFRSILARTTEGSESSRLFPGEWLTVCCGELQNVFLAFDGNMMASAVIALLDETKGCLHHLNAEHPPIVRFRSGRASFIGTKIDLPRFGFPGENCIPEVQTTFLVPGDVIVLGTDGRDDLLLHPSANATGCMNDDPELFLKLVEMAEIGGPLPPVDLPPGHRAKIEGTQRLEYLVALLESRGRLIDDLALMRLKFKGACLPAKAESPGRTTSEPHRTIDPAESLSRTA